MSDTKLLINGEHVLRRSWSEKDNALKIIPAENTHFSIELDAADGDNIRTIPDNAIIQDTEEKSCVGMSTACLYGKGRVFVSPSDQGDDWFELSDTIIVSMVPFKICARRIKITSGKLVMMAV